MQERIKLQSLWETGIVFPLPGVISGNNYSSIIKELKMAHTVIATWIEEPRGICLCVRVCVHVRVHMSWLCLCFCMYADALGDLRLCACGDVCADRGSWELGYVSEKKAGWEDLFKCAQLCRKQLWHLCWSTANTCPISRSILSMQALHIFHCVEQYFSMILGLLCIENMQSAPNVVCVCYWIKPFISSSAVYPNSD